MLTQLLPTCALGAWIVSIWVVEGLCVGFMYCLWWLEVVWIGSVDASCDVFGGLVGVVCRNKRGIYATQLVPTCEPGAWIVSI
jgi:hypothetical protein